MITIATFDNLEEAALLQAKLQHEGITAYVADCGLISVNWMYANAVGGIKVQVAAVDQEQAREVLLQIGLTKPSEPLSPYRCASCDSTKVEFRRISKAVFMLSILLLGLPLALIRPRFHCLNCGRQWKKEHDQEKD